ncbi:hypothetical protein S40293_00496 [Stachybotrys chartarum IBT 40293]|nr:hypothetical protein S40293_00496 [Stachybotrys chartarum IBT 40293]
MRTAPDPAQVELACRADLDRTRQNELPLSYHTKGASYAPTKPNGVDHIPKQERQKLGAKWQVTIDDEESRQMEGLVDDNEGRCYDHRPGRSRPPLQAQPLGQAPPIQVKKDISQQRVNTPPAVPAPRPQVPSRSSSRSTRFKVDRVPPGNMKPQLRAPSPRVFASLSALQDLPQTQSMARTRSATTVPPEKPQSTAVKESGASTNGHAHLKTNGATSSREVLPRREPEKTSQSLLDVDDRPVIDLSEKAQGTDGNTSVVEEDPRDLLDTTLKMVLELEKSALELSLRTDLLENNSIVLQYDLSELLLTLGRIAHRSRTAQQLAGLNAQLLSGSREPKKVSVERPPRYTYSAEALESLRPNPPTEKMPSIFSVQQASTPPRKPAAVRSTSAKSVAAVNEAMASQKLAKTAMPESVMWKPAVTNADDIETATKGKPIIAERPQHVSSKPAMPTSVVDIGRGVETTPKQNKITADGPPKATTGSTMSRPAVADVAGIETASEGKPNTAERFQQVRSGPIMPTSVVDIGNGVETATQQTNTTAKGPPKVSARPTMSTPAVTNGHGVGAGTREQSIATEEPQKVTSTTTPKITVNSPAFVPPAFVPPTHVQTSMFAGPESRATLEPGTTTNGHNPPSEAGTSERLAPTTNGVSGLDTWSAPVKVTTGIAAPKLKGLGASRFASGRVLHEGKFTGSS